MKPDIFPSINSNEMTDTRKYDATMTQASRTLGSKIINSQNILMSVRQYLCEQRLI